MTGDVSQPASICQCISSHSKTKEGEVRLPYEYGLPVYASATLWNDQIIYTFAHVFNTLEIICGPVTSDLLSL